MVIIVPRFEKRVRAFAIDTSAVMIAVIISAFGFPNMRGLQIGIVMTAFFGFYILPYFISSGQSFGKRIQKIKIVKLDGSKANIFIILLREFFKIGLSIITFGFYMLLAYFFVSEKEKSMTIHDYIFRTKMIDLEKPKNRNNPDFMNKTESMRKKGF